MAKKKQKKKTPKRTPTPSRLTRSEWAAELAKARARKLSPEQRRQIAKAAAEARWRKRDKPN